MNYDNRKLSLSLKSNTLSQEKTILLIPVYNDWESLKILITNLAPLLKTSSTQYELVIADDGSLVKGGVFALPNLPIQILKLHRNLGHQKAIAIGLAYIHHHMPCDNVIILDGDGEDRPEDASALLAASAQHPRRIIFAHRSLRVEPYLFRLFYFFYKILFRLLTGKKIAYGNFMVLPKSFLDTLVYHNEIWNHLSAAVIKGGFPFTSIQTTRGKRYAGKSNMSFTDLLLHGFGAISVFIEQMASRLLIFSVAFMFISIVAICIILGIRWFTDMAIPGWASTVVLSMLVVLLQSILISLFTLFLFLSSQTNRKLIPALHYTDYYTGTEEKPVHE
jgi:glycosyltransferase involved in cell wall biosynthesis